MIVSLLLFVGLLVLVGFGVVLLVRQIAGRPVPAAAGDAPLEIARRRLAAGEITITEYEEIRGRLQS
jgi:uncharacterized membrane protein